MSRCWVDLPPPQSSQDQSLAVLAVVDPVARAVVDGYLLVRLVSAWNQGARGDADPADEADEALIGASAEPRKSGHCVGEDEAKEPLGKFPCDK